MKTHLAFALIASMTPGGLWTEDALVKGVLRGASHPIPRTNKKTGKVVKKRK